MITPLKVLSTFILLCSYISATSQPILYNTLFNNSSFSRTIDVSKAVGATDGVAGTNPAGAATYTIPIKCPPGTNGLAPQISLVYNSQGGNGILGQGWSLSGLSVITRVGKDFYHDGKAAPAAYTNADALMLDGQRLVLESGSTTDYRTEAESYATISALGTIGSDPHYFSVKAKDGSIMEYGFSEDSRIISNDGTQIMTWRLNKIQDINGNYIWFYYSNSDRESRLVKIAYTGNLAAGIAPYNEINFQYGTRSDWNTTYEGGSSFNSKYLLWEIQIKGEGGDKFKTYQFEYGKNNVGVSYLNKVFEMAPDNSSLNDTRFKYGEQIEGLSFHESNVYVNYNPASPTSPIYDIFAGDYDGDGKTDILRATYNYLGATYFYDRNYTDFQIYSNTATSSTYSVMPGSTTTLSPSSNHYVASYQRNTEVKGHNFIHSDFDGDGRDDILFMNLSSSNNFNGVTIYYSRFGTASPGFTVSDIPAASSVSGHALAGENALFTGDFDGDGRNDYIYMTDHTDPSTGNKVYHTFVSFPGKGENNNPIMLESNPSQFDAFATLYLRNSDMAKSKVYILDFDGDGSSELMCSLTDGNIIYKLEKNSSGVYYFKRLMWHVAYPIERYQDIKGVGDFNGDGKSDLLVNAKANRGIWEIAYSDGKTFNVVPFYFDAGREYLQECVMVGGTDPSPDDLFIADFNGDGKSDILHKRAYCNADNLYKTDFIYYIFGAGSRVSNVYTYPYALSERVHPIITDENGDGKAELSFKRIGLTGSGASPSQEYMHTMYFQKDSKSHLLEKVTDGFNRTTTFSYEPLTKGTGTGDGAFYVKGSGETYPVNNAQYPIYVATSISQPDGVGGVATTWLGYDNLRVHRGGRGLLGFEKVKSYNVNTESHNQVTYDLNRDFYISYLKTSKSFPESNHSKYKQVTNNFTFTRIGSGFCFTQTNPSGSSEDHLTGSTGNYSNTYDSYGNITYSTSSTLIAGGESMVTSITNTMMATGGSPTPNRPQYIVTESKRGAMPAQSTQEFFQYDGSGRVTHHLARSLPLTATGTFITDYQYNVFGNVKWKQDRTMPGDLPTYWPITQYVYDDKGRYALKEINAIGDTIKKTMHKFWGNPLTITNLSGLVSTFTYNQWGKQISASIPVSTASTYTINYSDAWDISGTQLYYTLSNHPYAPDVKTWYDLLSRPVKMMQEGFSGWTTSLTTYDNRGNQVSATNNYLSTETPRITTSTYDVLNRLSSITDFSGITNYSYEYFSGATLVKINGPSGIKKRIETDGLGKVRKSFSDTLAGTVHYTYDSHGNEIKAQTGTWTGSVMMNLIAKEYDPSGRLTKTIDPDAGTLSYTYDAFGRLLKHTDAAGVATNYTYDNLGRLVFKELDDYKTTYEYYDKAKDYALKSQEIVYPTGLLKVKDEYEYANGGGLVSTHTRTALGYLFEKKYSYNAYGQLGVTEYVNSGFRKQNIYNSNGYLRQIKTFMAGGGSGEKILYDATAQNGDGQLRFFSRVDAKPSTINYTNGFVTNLTTSGIQNLAMAYDYARGNVLGRADNIVGVYENFEYDLADRLTRSQADMPPSPSFPGVSHAPIVMEYDNHFWGSHGRLKSKSDVGAYSYGSFPRDAVATIQDPANLVNHATQNILYRPFHKAGVIIDTFGTIPYREVLDYDADEHRVRSEKWIGGTSSGGGTLNHRRWYFGDFELDQDMITGDVKMLHYIVGDAGLCGIVVDDGGSFAYHGVYTDHLGSIVTVTDDAGNIVAKQSFDPWGRERNPEDWGYGAPLLGPTKPSWLYRGYTGHEMLPEYGLINMNGRMYDPINGRMLRPDNYIQDPMNSQSYNRFSYCWNNPMSYTDPTGDLVWLMPTVGVGADGKLNFSLSVGIGAPGVLSAQATIGHDLGSGNTFAGVSGNAGFFNAGVGWGTQTGFTANVGFGIGFGSTGIGSNMTSFGIGWTQQAGVFGYFGGIVMNENGSSFSPSISYSIPLVIDYSAGDLGGPGDEELVKAVRRPNKAASTTSSAEVSTTYYRETIIPGLYIPEQRLNPSVAADIRAEMSTAFNRFSPAGRGLSVFMSVIDMARFAQKYEKGQNIGLPRFTQKSKNGALKDPKTKEYIEPDNGRNSGVGGHGGSWWKLYSKDGSRIGTISKEGVWLRK